MAEEHERERNEDDDHIERPLEPWELREFREKWPHVKAALKDYAFVKQLARLLRRTAIGAGVVFTGIYTGKDMIVRIIKAIFG